ncbi:hypothetical protein ACFQZE_06670 [Paenibacillus sp. GCM10027627]
MIKQEMLHQEVIDELEKYGVPYENLTAVVVDYYGDDPITEALTYINNCEGNIDDNIEEIEKVFLHFVNKRSQIDE